MYYWKFERDLMGGFVEKQPMSIVNPYQLLIVGHLDFRVADMPFLLQGGASVLWMSLTGPQWLALSDSVVRASETFSCQESVLRFVARNLGLEDYFTLKAIMMSAVCYAHAKAESCHASRVHSLPC